MKERPILFSAPMVQAILAGEKSQTRRVIKPQPFEHAFLDDLEAGIAQFGYDYFVGDPADNRIDQTYQSIKCKFGNPGDHLWVRETWADVNTDSGPAIAYRAGGIHFCQDDAFPVEYERYPGQQFTMWYGDLRRGEEGHAWKSPIHMPRWASRILLEITGVRVERVQDITKEDAKAEGALWGFADYRDSERDRFQQLWNTIHAKDGFGWESNPFVWCIEFKRLEVAP